MELKEIENIIRKCRDRKTCFPGDTQAWVNRMPEKGQCAVTALLVQELFGGDILYNKLRNHFWNITENGLYLDLTKQQVKGRLTTRGNIVGRNYLLHSDDALKYRTFDRYQLLKERVKKKILKDSTLRPLVEKLELHK